MSTTPTQTPTTTPTTTNQNPGWMIHRVPGAPSFAYIRVPVFLSSWDSFTDHGLTRDEAVTLLNQLQDLLQPTWEEIRRSRNGE